MASEIRTYVDSLELIRLNKDLELIEQGLKENVQEEKNEKDNFFKKLGKNISNSNKESKTKKLNAAKDEDNKKVEALKAADAAVKDNADDVKNGLANLLKSKSTILAFETLYNITDTNTYNEKEETEKVIANLIAGNDTALDDAAKAVDGKYGKVGGGLFASFKASAAATMGLEAYLIAKTSAKEADAYSTAEKIVAGFEGNDNDKKAATEVAALLLTGEDKLPYALDEAKGQEAFSALGKDDLAAALALRAAFFEADKADIKTEEVNEITKVLLKTVNDLTYAIEVQIMIDKKDQENATAKLETLNRFVSALAEILK